MITIIITNPIRNHTLSTNSISLSECLTFIAVIIILNAQSEITMVHIIEIISAVILLIKESELCKVKPHIQTVSVSLRGIDAGVKKEINIKKPPKRGNIQEDSFILLIQSQLKVF